MRNLKIKKFNSNLLKNATLIHKGTGYMDTYKLKNGLILKKIKKPDDLNYIQLLQFDDFMDSLTKKLHFSKYLDNDSLVLPDTIYTSKDMVDSYSVPCIDLKSFDEYLSQSNDLDFITKSFDLLANEVKKLNKDDIVLPDLANDSNILYSPKDKVIKFIDYDGIQVGDYDSSSVASLMHFDDNLFFTNKKYFNRSTTLFTPNFDKASLLALYLYYTTHTRLADFNVNFFERVGNKWVMKDGALDLLFEFNGLLGSPLEDDIRRVYSLSDRNKYLNTSIKRLNKEYTLDFSRHTFIKR